MPKAPPCPTGAQKVLQPFTDLLRAAPHRDCTHVSYSQWFRLYVDLLRTTRRQPTPTTAAAGAIGNAAEPHRTAHADTAATLCHVRASIDASMWSSLMAHRWGEVLLPPQAADALAHTPRTEPAGGPGASAQWYIAGPRSTLEAAPSPSMRGLSWDCVAAGGEGATQRGGLSDPAGITDDFHVASATEVVSPGHLTEPLLGGASVAEWMAELRRSAAERVGQADEAATPTPSAPPTPVTRCAPTFYVVIPFSTLFELKYRAHLRPTHAVSLQERRALQALLQSLGHLLQVQADLEHRQREGHVRGAGDSTGGPLLQIRVLSATQEFDALCSLPRVRPLLSSVGVHDDEGGAGSADAVGAAALSLGVLCEEALPRIVYLARYTALQQALQAPAGQRGARGDEHGGVAAPVALLTHAADLRVARRLGSPLPRERCHFREWRQGVLESMDAEATRGRSGARGSLGGGNVRTLGVHEQARRGCGDMVRRMTHREENIRQSFAQP